MNIFEIAQMLQKGKTYRKNVLETKEYTQSRYAELINKGYSAKAARDMVYFELGFKYTTATIAKDASKGALFSLGAEAGAGIGFTVGGPPGAFAGAGIGGLGTMYAGGKAISKMSEAGIQHLSEFIWSEYKSPEEMYIDLNKAGMYIESADKSYITNPKPHEAFIYADPNFENTPTGQASEGLADSEADMDGVLKGHVEHTGFQDFVDSLSKEDIDRMIAESAQNPWYDVQVAQDGSIIPVNYSPVEDIPQLPSDTEITPEEFEEKYGNIDDLISEYEQANQPSKPEYEPQKPDIIIDDLQDDEEIIGYVWVADGDACDECQALNGTKYESEDDIPDEPHPNCQCTIEPIYADELQDEDEDEEEEDF